MGEEIEFENGRISYFRGLVTLTLILDRVILHTVMHHASTSTYIPNTKCTEPLVWMHDCLHLKLTLLGRLEGVDHKMEPLTYCGCSVSQSNTICPILSFDFSLYLLVLIAGE